ncbi:CiV19.5g2-like-9 protein [Chelonus insularis]|nr:CiV19.5g2-like-9 protein [Chelonus insularis]
MDSVNSREYRTRLARKILKINKELNQMNEQSVGKWKGHLNRDHNYIMKLQHDKKKLQVELQFMCRKVVMLSDEIIEALGSD